MPEASLRRGLTHLQAAEFLYETNLLERGWFRVPCRLVFIGLYSCAGPEVRRCHSVSTPWIDSRSTAPARAQRDQAPGSIAAATRSPGREDQGHRSPSSAARTAGDTSASADRAACCRWERTPARSPRHRAWSTRSGRATRPAPPRRLCGPDTRPAAGEGPPRTCEGRSGPSGPRRAPAAAAWSSTTWWTAKALAYPCITRKVTPEVSRIGASVPRTVPFSDQTSTREGWSRQ